MKICTDQTSVTLLGDFMPLQLFVSDVKWGILSLVPMIFSHLNGRLRDGVGIHKSD